MSTTPPIPPPKDDDAEDVFWALSTATTLHSRGEHAESLRWLRRAAEQASDQNADGRAVELMKAAADLSAKLNALPTADAPRPSTPPPLPKKAAPSIPAMPSRPPPLPSAPPRAIPAPPSVPRALAASGPIKPANRPARERHGTLTGRRVALRRGSSTELGKVARPPGVPAEIPDTPVDDLDEDTNVYEGRTKLSKGRKPTSADSASKPASPPVSPPTKPRGAPAPPASKPVASVQPSTSKPAAMKVEPVSVRESTKPEPAAKPLESKLDVFAKPVTMKATTPKPTASTSDVPSRPVVAKVEDIYPSKPAIAVGQGALASPGKPEAKPPVARAATLRKGTMQLVDEGFESMLDAPEPPSVAVPIFVELPIPPEEAKRDDIVVPAATIVAAEIAKPAAQPVRVEPAPRALLAQRVAVIADPSGAARVVLLEDLASLPHGAVAAIVVPLSPDDGEPLAALLRGPKG